MPTQFAVIDAGSNAIRLQVATVDQPGSYRIVEAFAFQQEIVRKLSGILRGADALDFDHQSKIRDVSCKLQSSKKLAIHVSGKGDLTRAIDYALEKAELMNEIYDVKTIIE